MYKLVHEFGVSVFCFLKHKEISNIHKNWENSIRVPVSPFLSSKNDQLSTDGQYFIYIPYLLWVILQQSIGLTFHL
jgi:hypothetical protein